jgi:hypothetical protein
VICVFPLLGPVLGVADPAPAGVFLSDSISVPAREQIECRALARRVNDLARARSEALEAPFAPLASAA